MADSDTDLIIGPPGRVARRRMLQRMGVGVAGAAAAGAMGVGGAALSSKSALAAPGGLTDVQIFNFALNLEYLEAEYYLRAFTGSGLAAAMTTGVGTKGTVTGGSQVPFKTAQVAFYAERIAADEQAHVAFIRSVLGASAVAEPNINLSTSFTTAAIAAGVISAGQTFNPFADELSFMIGAYIFEDVGVTAYAGAAPLISSPTNLGYAAGILGTEAYHAGAVRGYLAENGAGLTTVQISSLRSALSGVMDFGTISQGNPFNFSNVDFNAQVFRRTPAQVLNIVYGNAAGTPGLFFPTGINAGNP